MKKFILGLTLGLVIAVSIGVYAANQILASEIGYKNGKKVSDALDELYSKADGNNSDNLYLYWQGNEYDDITGGWESSLNAPYWAASYAASVTRKQAVKEENYIDLTLNGDFQYVPINTKNKVDCTDYNYINIYYTYTTHYRAVYRVVKDLETENYAAEKTSTVSSNLISGNNFDVNPNNKKVIVQYPISCSEPGYIAINTAKGDSSDPNTDLKIYGIYLSK